MKGTILIVLKRKASINKNQPLNVLHSVQGRQFGPSTKLLENEP